MAGKSDCKDPPCMHVKSRAETSSHASSGVVQNGSKLRGPSPKALVQVTQRDGILYRRQLRSLEEADPTSAARHCLASGLFSEGNGEIRLLSQELPKHSR
ncbi:hypothetical protein TNCV_5001191 [Trichonephila clavipes]|nr:hypothetical protein TNCV_5001191 [Trichonephila clavipes]